MTPINELISVIVPAYNAEQYIARTLESILRQTHRNIEVLVVDDGSKDATAEIVRAYADVDARVQLIQQENGGVARARNNGIAQARGELVAPCDADDLWAPHKLEKQLEVFRAGRPHIGLVYCWTAVINSDDLVMNYDSHPTDDGHVFHRMCKGNLIGNGSATLMLKKAVQDAGGYDASLRDRGAQGCEDYKLYLQIAHDYTFGVMKEYGVGYRHTDDNMSSDVDQMLRSYDIVIDEIEDMYPNKRKELREGRAGLIDWFRLRAMNSRRWWAFCKLQIRLMRYDLPYAIKSTRWGIIRPIYGNLKWSILKWFKTRPRSPGEIIPGTHKFIGEAGTDALHQYGEWPESGAAVSRVAVVQSSDVEG